MRDQAEAFRSECEGLRALLAGTDALDYSRRTQFKSWSFDDVLRHLHFWNIAADTSLDDEAGFEALRDELMARARDGDMRAAEAHMVGALSGAALLGAWSERAGRMAERFADADPKCRLKWVGPSMSARSSITARLMETWAHGQELYDELGVERINSDAVLRNVTVLGVNTFGWTFVNRKLDVPPAMPRLRLTAPSGELWEWGDGQGAGSECIEGTAEAFCQVVTQVRNVADTDLRVTGATAERWMGFAQCFAGPPNDPPAPGTRFRRNV
ncbi:MAG: TIGR03084 family metal-binding protein [Pseudomonadales bacterium]|jgi:uncharacterized protein (TIGR03084 family)|nr:TIGR03084 family metal-binding protein [Pseudomonadales bacterium]